MLSNIDIKKKVDKGELVVQPWDPDTLKPASIPVHLSDRVAIAKKGKIDPLKEEDYTNYFTQKKLSKGESIDIAPGQFILARTLESFGVPKNLTMFIDGKTTLARLGISINQSAMLIHPGSGVPNPRAVILEIDNTSPFTVKLTQGMQIGEVFLHELKTPTDVGYDEEWPYGTREDLNSLFPTLETK